MRLTMTTRQEEESAEKVKGINRGDNRTRTGLTGQHVWPAQPFLLNYSSTRGPPSPHFSLRSASQLAQLIFTYNLKHV
ncbi:unnamed protein product [Nezara viridula]|uniref:Uncharacterized protein n=1 Tax=Nezara viridula TaxID=85310 RepID=A0A9P0HFV0_NEZVI|nr:unnamed protein product [Nezara viridula]